MSKNIAIIDIGSNSVRFVLKNRDCLFDVKKSELVSTALGTGLASSGMLRLDKMDDTFNAVTKFYESAKSQNADEIHVFATEAVRAATNSDLFIDRLKNYGIQLDVLSGDEEAEIAYMGASGGRLDRFCVFDIGGASVEIVVGEKGVICYRKSLPLGMVRLLDMFGADKDKIDAYIKQQIINYGDIPHFDKLIGISGTATSAASILLNQKVYDENAVHGYTVCLNALENLKTKIFDDYSPEKLLSQYPQLGLNRAKVMGHGVIMLINILEYLGKDSFTVSENGNLEGYVVYREKLNQA